MTAPDEFSGADPDARSDATPGASPGPDAAVGSGTPPGQDAAAGTDPDPLSGDDAISLVDWERTGRRVGRVLAVLGAIVLVAWLAVGIFGGEGLRPRLLAEFVGLALLVAFLAEVVVVGGAAARGMLRAGERGERLAGSDVSLFPPQLRRRR